MFASPLAGPVLFSPLWAALYINFGMGPILARTNEVPPRRTRYCLGTRPTLSPRLVQSPHFLQVGPPAVVTGAFVAGVAAVLLARKVLVGDDSGSDGDGGIPNRNLESGLWDE